LKIITLVIENEAIFHSVYLKQILKKFHRSNKNNQINVCIYMGGSASNINKKIIKSCLKYNLKQLIQGAKFFLINYFKRMINNETNISSICENDKISYNKILNNFDLLEHISNYNTDYLINASSLIFNEDIFKKNVIMINKHSGKIPEYMGSYPLFWSFFNLEQKFYITINFIELAIDEGAVIYEKGFSSKNITLISCYFRSFIYSSYIITNLLNNDTMVSKKKSINDNLKKFKTPNQKDLDNFFRKKLCFF
tara:strand:+ start:661 stop:1416 length:756 start_codon:yes stop_codon:yes gene_type:complete